MTPEERGWAVADRFRDGLLGPGGSTQTFNDAVAAITAALHEAQAPLLAAIRRHRDYRGDDRCWQDDEELYRALPEGYAAPAREVAVELELCERYIRCRRNPTTEYVSPQRRIEELEAELDRLRETARGRPE